jgi:GNAT superfamily N-acetyltransferase
MRIRGAREEDVATILELIRGLAEYEHLADRVTATENRIRETLFGAKPGAEALLAEVGDEAVGLAIFFTNYSTFLAKPGIYLEDLFVKAHARGRGVGRALLKRIAQMAVERECGRLEWAVLNWNEPSIQFYESFGAVAMKDWTVYRLTGEALTRLAGS